MSLRDTMADDYQLWDNADEIVLTTPRGVRRTLSGVLVREVHTGQQVTAGALNVPVVQCVFVVPSSQLEGYLPCVGDVVTDGAGVRWRVTAADELTLATRWRLGCQRLLD